MIRVAIVEDEKNYNNALKRMLEISNGFCCVAQFFSGKEALMMLPNLQVDVVLMDLKLNDLFGTEVIKTLINNRFRAKFLVITSFDDEEKVLDAIKSGAVGYLIKGEELEKILSSIRNVYDGGVPLSNEIAHKLIKLLNDSESNESQLSSLTDSEFQVLRLLAQGKQYKEIADIRRVSVQTVKKQVSNIYQKLGVHNKIEAIQFLNNKK